MSSDQEKELKRQEKKEKINRIRKMLAAMSEDERNYIASKYGITTIEGHPLTAHNQCFLVAQAEINFSIVGGFVQWKKAGRIVRKGEHGNLIFVPSKSKTEGKEELSEEDVRFFTATVFDITQTDLLQKTEVA